MTILLLSGLVLLEDILLRLVNVHLVELVVAVIGHEQVHIILTEQALILFSHGLDIT